MPEQKYICVRNSANRKLGGMPVVYADATSCPVTCPLLNNGCYAEQGPTAYLFNDLTAEAEGRRGKRKRTTIVDFAGMLKWVSKLPCKTLWRYGVSGDLPGDGNAIDPERFWQLVNAAAHTHGFCYTHKPIWNDDDPVHLSNRAMLNNARRACPWFVVNVSTDSLADARYHAREFPLLPLVMLQERGSPIRGEVLPATHINPAKRYVTCPEQVSGLTCTECHYCAKQRDGVVGFIAHGTRARKVEAVVRGK